MPGVRPRPHGLLSEWIWPGPADLSGGLLSTGTFLVSLTRTYTFWPGPVLGLPLNSVGQLLPLCLLIPPSRTRAPPRGSWEVVCSGRRAGSFGGVCVSTDGGDESGIPGKHLPWQSSSLPGGSLPSTLATATALPTPGKPGWRNMEGWL